MAASCSALWMFLSPSWLPMPLPGCLLACLESLLPCPLLCCEFSAFLASWPSSPSCASPCWPCCGVPSLLFCCLDPCWDLPAFCCCSCEPCWLPCCGCCCGFTRDIRFWNASFTLFISELSLDPFWSCDALCC